MTGGPMRPNPAEVRLLACDYDRTLTDEHLHLDPDTVDAIGEARKLGLKVVVVSGRDMAFLKTHLGEYVDALVAENGCYLQMNGGSDGMVCLAPDAPPLRQLFAEAGLKLDDLEHGETLASVPVHHEHHLRRVLAAHLHRVAFIRNRDRVMVLPHGVDKAAGLLLALKKMDVEPRQAAAAGDGENDHALLRVAGYRIAVANGVDALKAEAHHVTRLPGGAGVAEWIREAWIPARIVAEQKADR